jgi:hypothetical protein
VLYLLQYLLDLYLLRCIETKVWCCLHPPGWSFRKVVIRGDIATLRTLNKGKSLTLDLSDNCTAFLKSLLGRLSRLRIDSQIYGRIIRNWSKLWSSYCKGMLWVISTNDMLIAQRKPKVKPGDLHHPNKQRRILTEMGCGIGMNIKYILISIYWWDGTSINSSQSHNKQVR